MSCTGPAYQGHPTGKKTLEQIIDVVPAGPLAPTIGLFVGLRADSITIPYNHSTLLHWEVAGSADSCTASSVPPPPPPPPDGWTGLKPIPAPGKELTESTSKLTEDHTYTITCTKNPALSSSKTVTVKVGPAIPSFQEVAPK